MRVVKTTEGIIKTGDTGGLEPREARSRAKRLKDDACIALGIDRKRGAFGRQLMQIIRGASVPVTGGRDSRECMFRAQDIRSDAAKCAVTGVVMEETTAGLGIVREALGAARDELEDTMNSLTAVANQLMPLLAEQMKILRETRMAVKRETTELLAALKDVRTFFVAADYTVEMARIQQFVQAANELQRLKNDGTLDAVIDIALRLEVKQ